MSYAVVTLKKGEGRTLKAGGAWIFDNEIESITGGFDNGSIVLVHDFDGYPMGRGFINQNSKIRVRMMTRDIHQEIDEAFLRMRVKNAWEYRKTTVDTSSCRLIFGEADFLPGLTVDKYEDVLVVECLALGMEAFKETIVNLLKEVLAEDGVIIRGVFERSDANERKKEGLPKVKGWIGEMNILLLRASKNRTNHISYSFENDFKISTLNIGHKCHPVTFRLYRAIHFDSYIFIHILQSKSQKSPSPTVPINISQ